MLDLKKLLSTKLRDNETLPKETTERRIQVATCSLLLELANADNEFADVERESIISILKTKFNLSDEDVIELMKESEQELKDSIDMWHLTTLINQNFSEKEKIKVLESAWKVIYADGRLDQYEDYLVHKIANLLRLNHNQLIKAKLSVSASRRKSE